MSHYSLARSIVTKAKSNDSQGNNCRVQVLKLKVLDKKYFSFFLKMIECNI